MKNRNIIGFNLLSDKIERTTIRVNSDGQELAQFDCNSLNEIKSKDHFFQQNHSDVIIASLPANEVLLHVFNFPTIDPDEIEGMVELQIDKISPYPLAQIVVSHEILAQNETHTLVLVAGARRELIEEKGAFFKDLGLTLSSLDINLICRWNQLLSANKVSADYSDIFLIIENNEAGLIITKNGEPILFKSLFIDELSSDLFEEINYSLATLEQAFQIEEASVINVWKDDFSVFNFKDLNTNGEFSVALNSLHDLPKLSDGLVRRYQNRNKLELIPKEWIESAKSKALMRSLYKFGAIAFAAWLSIGVIFFMAVGIHSHQVKKLRAVAENLSGPAKEVQETSRKVSALSGYTDQSNSALETLREICAILPKGIELSSFSFKKGEAATLRGEAVSDEAIYSFFDILAKSEFFKEVKDQRVTMANHKGKRISQFSLTAVLEGAE